MTVANIPAREIFVVDDDPTAGEALATLLADAGFQATLFGDGASIVAEARIRAPACIVLNLHTPDVSELDILTALDARRYPAPILVISDHSDISRVVEAIKRGAFDYIEKQRAADKLIACVREAIDATAQRAANGGDVNSAKLAFPGAASLTPREHEVLAQIVSCASNKEAATKLGISRRTVEIHRAHIMQKLGAKNSIDLMRIVLSPASEKNPRRLSA